MKFLTLFILIFVFNQGFAQEGNYFTTGIDAGAELSKHYDILPKITVTESGKVFVYIFNPHLKAIEVNLRDPEGNSLHKEKTASYYYGKILNVSELGAGKYHLWLTVDGVSARYGVDIVTDRHYVRVRQMAIANDFDIDRQKK